MKKEDKLDWIFDGVDNILESKTLKYIAIAGVALGALFVAGYVFNIAATTVTSYKNLHKALKS